jgi:hypothetical protein
MSQTEKKKHEKAENTGYYLFRQDDASGPAAFLAGLALPERLLLLTAAAMLIGLVLICSGQSQLIGARTSVPMKLRVCIAILALVPIALIFLALWMRHVEKLWRVTLTPDRAVLEGELFRHAISYKEVTYLVRGSTGPCVRPFLGFPVSFAIAYRRSFGDYLNALDADGKVLFSMRESGGAYAELHARCPGARVVDIEDYEALSRSLPGAEMNPELKRVWDHRN